MNSKNNKIDLAINRWLLYSLFLLIIIAFIISLFSLMQANIFLSKNITEAEEAARPGEVDITILTDKNCAGCFNPRLVIDSIKKAAIKVNSENEVEISSDEGKAMIAKYNITKAPTFIISGEIEKDKALKDYLSKAGEIKEDTFIFRQVGAPHILTNSGEVKGRVKITLIKDSSCVECYTVASHLAILQQIGLPINDQMTIDAVSSEGKSLISKYNITLVPTIVLSGDLDVFTSLASVWPQVGTIEKDGSYVFRSGVNGMGAYKNLATGKVILPPESKQTPAKE